MFSVNVVFGEGPNGMRSFLYKEEAAADSVYRSLISGTFAGERFIAVADDFGHQSTFDQAKITCVSFEDLDKLGDAANQRNLALAKAQCKMQELLNADPDPALKRVMQQQKQAAAMSRFANGGAGPGAFPM